VAAVGIRVRTLRTLDAHALGAAVLRAVGIAVGIGAEGAAVAVGRRARAVGVGVGAAGRAAEVLGARRRGGLRDQPGDPVLVDVDPLRRAVGHARVAVAGHRDDALLAVVALHQRRAAGVAEADAALVDQDLARDRIDGQRHHLLLARGGVVGRARAEADDRDRL